MPRRLAQEDQEKREQRVELQQDQQVVELVVAGAEEVQQMDGVRPRCPVLAGQTDQEVDDGPAQVRHGHQGEATSPERAVVDPRQVPDAVGEHAGRDEQKRLSGHVQQLQRRPHGQPRRQRREEQEGVGRHHARLFHRTHGVDVIEPLAGAPNGLRRREWRLDPRFDRCHRRSKLKSTGASGLPSRRRLTLPVGPAGNASTT